jgi:threonine dehydrogenase-like Zn-dependent dehydrogenase
VLCPLGEDEAALQPTLAERLQEEVGVDELVGDVADHCRAGVGCLIQDLWIQNGTLTMGLMATVSIPTLLTMVASGRIPAEKMGTRHFTFDQIDEAYDTFTNAGERLALTTVITPAQ